VFTSPVPWVLALMPAMGLLQNRRIIAAVLGFLALGCVGGAGADMAPLTWALFFSLGSALAPWKGG
jgi:hypothetical protein